MLSSGYLLDGLDDYLSFPDVLFQNAPFSIAMWARMDVPRAASHIPTAFQSAR